MTDPVPRPQRHSVVMMQCTMSTDQLRRAGLSLNLSLGIPQLIEVRREIAEFRTDKRTMIMQDMDVPGAWKWPSETKFYSPLSLLDSMEDRFHGQQRVESPPAGF